MKTMHLFAGAGGGLLADLILGHDPIIAVEWDKYVCQVLRERAAEGWFPNLRVYEGDVRMFDASEHKGRVDCIHAGFPCQDISTAGKRNGVGEDTRSGLYREALRIFSEVGPEYIFLENVSAILSGGMLGNVLGDLAECGFSQVRWTCLRASEVGANHHRNRWWLLAHTGHSGLLQRGQPCHDEGCARAVRDGIPSRQESEGEDVVAPPMPQRLSGWGLPSGTGQKYTNVSKSCGGTTQPQLGRMDDGMAYRLDGNWWQVEPDIGRVTVDCPNRAKRLMATGNGQVPLQAAVAFQYLRGLIE